jgi:hypothetical protein
MGYYIQTLRSDKEGKYLSNKFKTYYEKLGVQRYLTTPYTLQQKKIYRKKESNHIR